MVVYSGGGERVTRRANGPRASLGREESILKWIVVVVA